MLRTINLHNQLAVDGHLQILELDIDTPVMLMRGLRQLIEGFDERLYSLKSNISFVIGKTSRKRIKSKPRLLNEEGLAYNLGKNDIIHVIPDLEGGGFEIAAWILGVAVTSTSAIILGVIISIAISYALGAIAQSLASKPDTSKGASRPDGAPSFIFNGPINVTEQGYAIPLVYGKHLVGSIVISTDIDVSEYVPPVAYQPPGSVPYNPNPVNTDPPGTGYSSDYGYGGGG